jgi:Uma2 family endonuclease
MFRDGMRGVMYQIPENWLDERARLGLDRFDEMWEGVLHMVPAPGLWHQRIGSRLHLFLGPILLQRGIEVLYETGVHEPGSQGQNYRIPDLVFFPTDRPDLLSDRGIVGAPLVVLEVRSPDDETYDKFDFWAKLRVPEIVVISPESRQAEVYRLAGSRYVATSADDQKRVHVATIDVRFSTIPGEKPLLRVECAGASIEI